MARNQDRNILLSIDGGGLKGIIPLCALQGLEAAVQRPLSEAVSFVAGTSTGAIITAGLAAKKTAADMLDLYLTKAAGLFPHRLWNLPREAIGIPPFSIEQVREIVASSMGESQAMTLNQAPFDLLITAKRVPDGMPWYFVKDKPLNSGWTGNLSVVDCTTASAAAPFYFDPWTVISQEAWQPGRDWPGELVDGGVGVAGNPVYQACVEAFAYDHYDPAKTTVISLGTGRYQPDYQPGWIAQWPHAWHNWLLTELLSSPGEQQTEITHRLYQKPYEEAGMRLYRLDVDLGQEIDFGDATKVDLLHDIGKRFAAQINWQKILDGSDTRFRVTDTNTMWNQYRTVVPPT